MSNVEDARSLADRVGKINPGPVRPATASDIYAPKAFEVQVMQLRLLADIAEGLEQLRKEVTSD